MIRALVTERDPVIHKQWKSEIVSNDWGVGEGILAIALAVDKDKAGVAAHHLLNRLIYDACEALQGMDRLTPIQEFALAVLLEDPQACDAARDVLGI